MPLTTRYGFKDAPSPDGSGWSTLSAQMTAGASTFGVASASPYLTSVEFDVIVGLVNPTTGAITNSERLHVSGVSGSTFTVASACSLTHAAGETVIMEVTALGMANNPGAMTDAGDMQYLGSDGRMARLAAPADGSYVPVWASGVISWAASAIVATSVAANLILAGPAAGADAAPTFRSLVAADIANAAPGSDKQLLYSNAGAFGGFGSWDVMLGEAGQLSIGNDSSNAIAGGFLAPSLVASINNGTVLYDGFESVVTQNPSADVSDNPVAALDGELYTAGPHNFLSHLYSVYGLIWHYGTGNVSDGMAGYFNLEMDNGGSATNLSNVYANASRIQNGTVTNLHGLYVASPALSNGGAVTNNFGTWVSDFAGIGSNIYYDWRDSRGVYAIKEEFSQAVPRLYNPLFTKYTPGAANYERWITRWGITGQYGADDTLYLGAEAGGTGVLHPLVLLGSAISTTAVVQAQGGALIQDMSVGVGANAVVDAFGGYSNTAFGLSTLTSVTDGNRNAGFGYHALAAVTSGIANTGMGWNALPAVTTGSHNTALGYVALNDYTGVGGGGIYNTAIGSKTMYHSLNAQGNTGIGAYTLYWANGDYNTAVGYGAIQQNSAGAITTLTRNAAVGAESMQEATTASYNSALGSVTLKNNTTGNNNVAVGYQALFSNTTGGTNTAVGNAAGLSQTVGVTGLVALGNQAGRNNTTSDRFYVNNRARANETEDQTLSLLYGVFADTVAGQSLRINGTVTFPTPFTLGATSVTSTGTQLNYLSAATGTTGTTSTNLVFSTAPTLAGVVTFSGQPKLASGAGGASGNWALNFNNNQGFSVMTSVASGIYNPAGGWFATEVYAFTVSGSESTSDVRLYRDAAGIIAQRAGTTAQTKRIYYSFTDISNYARMDLIAGNGVMTWAAGTAGTGADDIDMAITPAGAGLLKFGTHAAIVAETLSGYITIKDAGGTSRKVAVIS